MDMREAFLRNPILAILRNIPFEDTVNYAQAAADGGITLFEVALNSPRALEQIKILSKKMGSKIIIGAGTVLSVDLAKSAIEAGAQFLLSPSADDAVLEYCQQNSIAFLPGVFTPSDVARCWRYGFHTLKLFPAGNIPIDYIKNLKGPFENSDYIAIGGVTPENIQWFKKAGCIGVGLGSNLMPKEAVSVKDWASCSAHVAELVSRFCTNSH